MMKGTKKKFQPKYRPIRLKLPWSHGLLHHYGLIRANADGVETLNTMDRLIRQRVIAQNRKRGLAVSQILALMSAAQLKKLRHAVRK